MRHERPPAFKDHFSGHATQYAGARPTYPDALFRNLAERCSKRLSAWDCATGNGQAARSLVTYFESVIATDASAGQIAAAQKQTNIEYRVAPAEAPGVDAESVDLVTVAQALHWFDIERFFSAARQALRPGGLLAYWCYGSCRIGPECDRIVQSVYRFVDEFWPPERRIVEDGYRSIPAPMPTVAMPGFRMSVQWDADQMLAYLESWSACQRYQDARGENPLDRYRESLRECWGDGPRTVQWPLILTVCRKPGGDGQLEN